LAFVLQNFKEYNYINLIIFFKNLLYALYSILADQNKNSSHLLSFTKDDQIIEEKDIAILSLQTLQQEQAKNLKVQFIINGQGV